MTVLVNFYVHRFQDQRKRDKEREKKSDREIERDRQKKRDREFHCKLEPKVNTGSMRHQIVREYSKHEKHGCNFKKRTSSTVKGTLYVNKKMYNCQWPLLLPVWKYKDASSHTSKYSRVTHAVIDVF